MPLIKSAGRAAVGRNISEMVDSGYPRDQAIAVSLRNARRYGAKFADGGEAERSHWLARGLQGLAQQLRTGGPWLEQHRAHRNALEAIQSGMERGQYAREVDRAERGAAGYADGGVPLPRPDPRDQPPALGDPALPPPGDQPLSRYPTKDDAAFARQQDWSYGQPHARYFNNEQVRLLTGDPNQRPFPATEYEGNALRGIRRIPGIRPTMDEYYARGALAAQRSPLAKLGFDPSRTAADVMRDPEKVNILGRYSPGVDQMYANARWPSTLVHESIHRGMERLSKSPFWKPEYNELLDSENENVVRYLMFKRMGDPEAADTKGKAGLEQRAWAIDRFTRGTKSGHLSKLLDQMESAAAQYLARIQPGGPRATGGKVLHAAGGLAVPWVQRAVAGRLSHAGMLNSPVPGRTDQLPISVKGGAYILPADHVAALGQGNSMAGAAFLDRMFKATPVGGGPGALRPARMSMGPRLNLRIGRAAGGPAPGQEPDVPIVAAGGEYAVPPDAVRAIGGGDLDFGHKVLDRWVLKTRKQHIKTLRTLKPPKKS